MSYLVLSLHGGQAAHYTTPEEGTENNDDGARMTELRVLRAESDDDGGSPKLSRLAGEAAFGRRRGHGGSGWLR